MEEEAETLFLEDVPWKEGEMGRVYMLTQGRGYLEGDMLPRMVSTCFSWNFSWLEMDNQ